MRRRALLTGLALAGFLPSTPGRWSEPAAAASEPGRPFGHETVLQMARELATRPYAAPPGELPRNLAEASYDTYRSIAYDRERALWRTEGLNFQVQPFHRGFLYKERVELYEVAEGRARPIPYDPAAFDLRGLQGTPPADLGFAGFRLTGRLNRADHFDEVISFLGASYFRALGRGQVYGLSARGLAIGVADRRGEEFPLFRSFWLQRPGPGMEAAVMHALLDSPSATGAYRFTVRPGDATVVDVEARLFPRAEIGGAGIAPLTSMFYFSPLGRARVDDHRGAVHDSDGLLVANGRGEVLWRPLSNPRDLQVSVLADTNPRGFGLMQRRRRFEDYGDLEARYHQRPSAWVEPVGDWGEGAIHLVEIPTQGEIHDNIVAFWRPKEPLRGGQEAAFTYRIHWTSGFAVAAREGAPPPAQFVASASGNSVNNQGARVFVLDAVGARLPAVTAAAPEAEVSTSAGRVVNVVVKPNPEMGGWRLTFELVAGNARLVELRALLKGPDGPLSETWLFRWTA